MKFLETMAATDTSLASREKEMIVETYEDSEYERPSKVKHPSPNKKLKANLKQFVEYRCVSVYIRVS